MSKLKKKVHIITQGCSANVADSEIMQGLLEKDDYETVNSIGEADVILYNTCTVKNPTVSTFKRTVEKIKKEHPEKKIVVGGCLPQSDRNNKELKEFSLLGTNQIQKVTQVVNQTLSGQKVIQLQQSKESRLNLPKKRINEYIEIVPILQGCLSSCTFCKTKHARGQLTSQKPEEIVRHISQAVKDGAKEIWLTSQDNSVYGLDIDTNLPNLLKDIINIPRDFKLRVGMANPHYLLPYIDELIPLLQHKKVFKFLHVPIQAGSNKVLKDMNRDSVVETYVTIANKLKQAIPNFTLATDIICGFPTESEEDFQKTMELMKQTRPDVINISRFWPRPGTKAALLKPLPGNIVKDRTRKLAKLHEEITKENNKKWLGWQGNIIITEKDKTGGWIGKNDFYKKVVIKEKQEEDLLGKEVAVNIKETTTWDLRGEIKSFSDNDAVPPIASTVKK